MTAGETGSLQASKSHMVIVAGSRGDCQLESCRQALLPDLVGTLRRSRPKPDTRDESADYGSRPDVA